MSRGKKDARGWQEFSYNGRKWSFSDSELAVWDDEMGWTWDSYHGLSTTTPEAIIHYLKGFELDELKPVIEAVLREALDAVEERVHICDRNNEAMKARLLSEPMVALYNAMRGNRDEPS